MDSFVKSHHAKHSGIEADIGCNRVFVLLVGLGALGHQALDIMKVADAEPIIRRVFLTTYLSASPRQRPFRFT
jgi:hypothetical protein